MKRTEQVESIICDFCLKNHAPQHNPCLGCGKHICYDCRQTVAKEYAHAVHYGGSGDGIYCLECDERLTAAGDRLHEAYRMIQWLRDESNAWGLDFKRRSDAAEADLKSVIKLCTL